MALPSREDFQELKREMCQRLDRLIELAEDGALSPTVVIHAHGEITEEEARAVAVRILTQPGPDPTKAG